MRLPLWLATLLCTLPMVAGGRNAFAQAPWAEAGFGAQGASYAAPQGIEPLVQGPGGYPPGSYPTNTPVGVQEGATAMPPGASPWPRISPYDNAFDQHYQKDGLWHRVMSNDYDRFVIVEGMLTDYRRPSGRFVGEPNPAANIFSSDTAGTPVNLRKMFDTGSDDTNWGSTGGIRFRLGTIDPDRSGLEFQGWWGGEESRSVLFGDLNARPSRPDLLSDDNPGLPLIVPPGSTGNTSNINALYDENVQISYSTEAFGGGLTWVSSRAVDLKALKIRPTVGIRYMGIRESLGFHGRGSGVDADVDRYEGTFQSKVRSHLFGPEIGFRLDLGGDNFKIINESKIAFAGVYEHSTLRGKGIGNGFNDDYDPRARFSDSQNHGHVSPVFEETISVEANIFSYIPVMKKMSLFDKAKVRLGYTLLWLSEIQRPSSIRYLSPELGNPQIEFDRADWYLQSFNGGVSWTY